MAPGLDLRVKQMRRRRSFKFLIAAWLVVSVQAVFAAPAAQLLPFWDDREENSLMEVDHSAWQQLLNKYLDDEHPSGINRFDYAAVTAQDFSSLRGYLDYLQSLDPRQLNGPEQKAYWINLYNSMTVLLILEEPGTISSIREIRSGWFKAGPWQRKSIKVALQEMSLDDIEHGVLRPIWRDNRVHYAVNCASLGCPNLSKTAFTAANVETLLQTATIEFINHPRALSITNGKLFLSQIYEWYAVDFGDSLSGVLVHLRRYAKPDLAAKLQGFADATYGYDWTLNRP